MAKYLDATGLAQVWAAAKGAFLTSSGGDGRYLRHYNDSSLDANSADPGWHDVINSITNAAHSNHSSLIYVSNVGTPFQLQIPDSTEDYIYKRSYTSSSWSSWRKMKAGYADSAGNASTAESATSASSALNLLPENTAHYFRDSSNASWRGGMFWGSAGSESMSFVAVNGSTRFQFVGGSDIASWTSNTWSSVTPYLTIYSSGIVTSGSATATGFVKSGSSDSYVLLGGGGHKAISDFATSEHTHSYLPLSGGTMTSSASVNFNTDSYIIYTPSTTWSGGWSRNPYRISAGSSSISFGGYGSNYQTLVYAFIGPDYDSSYSIRLYPSADPQVGGNKIWHAGNDGSGSGLDADTLDGYHASSFVTTSSIGTAASKDSTTVVSSGNNGLVTSGAVYSYIDSYLGPTRYETLTVTCSADQSGVSMYGTSLTIDGVTYTIPSDGTVIAQITADTEYQIIPGNKVGYLTPASQTITAVYGRQRSISLVWEKISYGVYILYTDGSLSTFSTKTDGKTPVGVVLYNDKVSMVIHPTEFQGTYATIAGPTSKICNNYVSGSNTMSYGYTISSSEVDYNGYNNSYTTTSLAGTAFSSAKGAAYADSSTGYLPSCGEMEQIRINMTQINTAFGLIGGTKISTSKTYWSSTQVYYKGSSYTWYAGAYSTLDGIWRWEWGSSNTGNPNTTYKCRSCAKYTI